ncbi:hypothetical protein FO519_004409 [Halicephalobus sp. NKZ332]|nr:hypothetical protein FO519_004409 [Halicephalobus sp. NKZ332]
MTEVDFPRGGAKPKLLTQTEPKEKKRKVEAKTEDGPVSKKSVKNQENKELEGIFRKSITSDLLVEDVRGLGSIAKIDDDSLLLKTVNGIEVVIPLKFVSRVYSETFKKTGHTLDDLFSEGQLLAFKVESALNSKENKTKRIQGSVCPSRVNKCVHSSTLYNGLVLNATVKSIEEKGAVFDLGIDGTIKGFASTDSLPPLKDLRVGQVMLVRIIRETGDAKRYIKLSAFPEMDVFEESQMVTNHFMPGTVLHAEPLFFVEGGIVVSFKNGLKAFVSKEQLPPRIRMDIHRLVKSFRVVVVICNQNSPLLTVSGHPDIVALSKIERRTVPEEYSTGQIFDGIVYSVDPKYSVYFAMQESEDKVSLITAKLPASNMDNPDNLKKYGIGTVHKIRVLKYSPLDRRVIVTDKKEILKANSIVEEHQPGQLVTVKIDAIVDIGVRVTFGLNKHGTIFANHTLDMVSQSWKKAFKVGQKIKSRVLYKDDLKNHYYLTSKPALVDSSDSIITDYDEGLIGSTATGMCTHIGVHGVVIAFFNKVAGFLPTNQANLINELKVGMPVTVKVSRVNADDKKIGLVIDATINKKMQKEKQSKKPVKPVKNLHIYPAKIVGSWTLGGTSENTSLLVELPNENIGRLHAAEIGVSGKNGINDFLKKNKGKKFHVRVIDVTPARKLEKSIKEELKERNLTRFYEVSVQPDKLKELKQKQSILKYKNDYKVGDEVTGFFVETPGNSLMQKAEVNPRYRAFVLPETAGYSIAKSLDEYGVQRAKPIFKGKGEAFNGAVSFVSRNIIYLALKNKKAPNKVGECMVARVISNSDSPLNFEIGFPDGQKGVLPVSGVTNEIFTAKRLKKVLKKNNLINVKLVAKNGDKWIVANNMKKSLGPDSIKKGQKLNGYVTEVEENQAIVEYYPGNKIIVSGCLDAELDDLVTVVVTSTKPELTGKFVETIEQEASRILHKEKILAGMEKSKDLFSDADYDRLIVSNPNSAEAWISYMAYQAQNGNVDEARKIAENALNTIEAREEQERLNIYTAYLSLEVTSGDENSLKEVFRRATGAHDQLEVYKRLANIYTTTNKNEELDKLFQVMIKKFGQYHREVYVLYGNFLYNAKREGDGRELMKKAMSSLPKKHHLELLSRFANLEYLHGDSERGKTMFEKALAAAPKRGDIWNVYIDKAIRYQSVGDTREIFERAIASNLGLHTTKNLFQKWQDFETLRGDEEHLQEVNKKAVEYTNKLKKDITGEDEDED